MLNIKLAEEKDLKPLSIIFAKSFTLADPERPWDEKNAYEYLKYWLDKQPDMFFVAFDDEENPIDASAVNIKPWRTGMRGNDAVLFVDPKMQKHKVGTNLLKRMIKEAIDKYNVEILESITFSANQFPLTWYQKIGMNIDERAVVIKGNALDILQKLS